jgi:acetolactate synthase-1/2/3 large subunit
MSSPDFVTAVEAGANILVVVLNDSRYGMITALQRGEFGRTYGDEIGWIDFARYAESFGAPGVRIEKPEEIPDAVSQALSLSARHPVILDAVCSHEYSWPNRDAITALGEQSGELST